jgi:hypothetical protein
MGADVADYYYTPDASEGNYFVSMSQSSLEYEALIRLNPSRQYSIRAIVGSATSNTVVFTTLAPTAPTITSIAPGVYTPIKYQRYGSCVAMSLSTIMERNKAIADYAATGATDYETFSARYIFGSDNLPNLDAMYTLATIKSCVSTGAPRWELLDNRYGDDIPKADAVTLYNSASSIIRTNAAHQKFTGYNEIDFYNGNAVANAIQQYGSVLMTLQTPNNLRDREHWDGNGLVEQPDTYANSGHAMVLIGLTRINNKAYWIAHNSWGRVNGDNGLFYVPYDWGAGCPSPVADLTFVDTAAWITTCYVIYKNNVSTANPSKPTNVQAPRTGEKTATVTWNSVGSGMTYYVMAQPHNLWDESSAYVESGGLWWWIFAPWISWWIKATTTSLSASLTFDTADAVDVMVIAMDSSGRMSMPTIVPVGVKPDAWMWYPQIYAGATIAIAAAHWNAFTSRINEWRAYKGLSSYSFTQVSSGQAISATIVNQARSAIQGIGTGVGTGVTQAVTGQPLQAAIFENMRLAINAL